MRIHTDRLTHQDLAAAAREANVNMVQSSDHGSRSRKRAFKIILSGSGRRASQWRSNDVPSATWDEWGVFLGHLFGVDPSAVATGAYENAEHYHWVTAERFRDGAPEDMHAQHRWEFEGRSPNGVYQVWSCKGRKGQPCSAHRRQTLGGLSWSELVDFTGA